MYCTCLYKHDDDDDHVDDDDDDHIDDDNDLLTSPKMIKEGI